MHYAPGTGCLDLPGIVAALKEIGFRGTMMLDLWLYPFPEDGSRIGVPYVAEVVRKLGLDDFSSRERATGPASASSGLGRLLPT